MTMRMLTPFVLSGLGLFVVAGCSGVPPANLGTKDGRLAPCPASPNCVSSQGLDREHTIDPLSYTTSATQALVDLEKVVLGMKRTRVVERTGNYLRAEFTSAIWRFVDDVEFMIDDQAKLIHVRSASRMGYSDMGVNRKRVEAIRSAWKEAAKEHGPTRL